MGGGIGHHDAKLPGLAHPTESVGPNRSVLIDGWLLRLRELDSRVEPCGEIDRPSPGDSQRIACDAVTERVLGVLRAQ